MQFVCEFFHTVLNPCIHLFIHPSIYPSIFPSIYSFIDPSIYLSSTHPSMYPSIHPSTHSSIRIAGTYSSSIFNFLRSAILFSILTVVIYIALQRVPFSQSPCQCLLFLIFLVMGVRWYLIWALICISLMVSDVEHLYVYLLVICICLLWVKVYSVTLPMFKPNF